MPYGCREQARIHPRPVFEVAVADCKNANAGCFRSDRDRSHCRVHTPGPAIDILVVDCHYLVGFLVDRLLFPMAQGDGVS